MITSNRRTGHALKISGAPFMFREIVYSLRPFSSAYYSCPKLTETWRDSKRCFIRFGELPPNGLSWNYLTEKFEAGTSVWCGRLLGGRVLAVMPTLWPGTLTDFFYMWADNTPVYVVRGTLLKAVGGVGEPLLANIDFIERVRYEGSIK